MVGPMQGRFPDDGTNSLTILLVEIVWMVCPPEVNDCWTEKLYMIAVSNQVESSCQCSGE